MRHYAIYVSDLREETDRLVDRRVNRSAAREQVRRLNQAVVEEHGVRGKDNTPTPLYYVVREDEG